MCSELEKKSNNNNKKKKKKDVLFRGIDRVCADQL